MFTFSNIVEKAETLNGVLICNTNPFLLGATILTILGKIKENYPPLKLRIETFEDDLLSSISRLLNKVYAPYKVRMLLKQSDLDRKSVLILFA